MEGWNHVTDGEQAAVVEVDNRSILSAVEYNRTGEFLATGDTAGNISLFRTELDSRKDSTASLDKYVPYFQFSSHVSEMDYLKSEPISPKINRIRFCDSVGDTSILLTANEKTIKLWKIGKKALPTSDVASRFVVADRCIPTIHTTRQSQTHWENDQAATALDDVSLLTDASPCVAGSRPSRSTTIRTTDYSNSNSPMIYRVHPFCRREFAHAHMYHINSLSCCTDGLTFLSADDLRIYRWHLERSDICLNMIDIKPSNMNELKEVITAAHFHPVMPHMLAYSTSRGLIRVYDTRTTASLDSTHRVYRDESAAYRSHSNRPFINDIMNSISDMTYSRDGRYLIVRDYLTVKVYDLNMESQPVQCISLHDYLQPMLSELFHRDVVFDKFEVCCSPDGSKFATGSYSNLLKVYLGPEAGLGQIEVSSQGYSPDTEPLSPASVKPVPSSRDTSVVESSAEGLLNLSVAIRGVTCCDPQWRPAEVDLDNKLLHLAWHPSADAIAVAAPSGLHLLRV